MKTPLLRLGVALLALVLWWGPGAFPALAQQFSLGGDFLIGKPRNEFHDKLNKGAYGASLSLGCFLADTPIMIGAELGFLNYGTEERQATLRDIVDVTFDVITTNNIFMLHGFARVQPQKGYVRPYFEGLWGFKYFFTQTTVERNPSTYYTFYTPIASVTNFSDFAGSWGVGMGMDIRLWDEGRKRADHDIMEVSLNIGVKYFWGSEAEYLKEGSISRNPNGGVAYRVSRSITDMLMPAVGIRIWF